VDVNVPGEADSSCGLASALGHLRVQLQQRGGHPIGVRGGDKTPIKSRPSPAHALSALTGPSRSSRQRLIQRCTPRSRQDSPDPGSS